MQGAAFLIDENAQWDSVIQGANELRGGANLMPPDLLPQREKGPEGPALERKPVFVLKLTLMAQSKSANLDRFNLAPPDSPAWADGCQKETRRCFPPPAWPCGCGWPRWHYRCAGE